MAAFVPFIDISQTHTKCFHFIEILTYSQSFKLSDPYFPELLANLIILFRKKTFAFCFIMSFCPKFFEDGSFVDKYFFIFIISQKTFKKGDML